MSLLLTNVLFAPVEVVTVATKPVAPVVVEKTAKRQSSKKPKFKFVYLKDGVSKTVEAAATGNQPKEFKDYLKETGKNLIDLVIPEDKERLVAELAKNPKVS